MKILLISLLALLATGCATVQDQAQSFVGQPISAALTKYGAPTSTTTVGDSTYYTWYITKHQWYAFPGVQSDCNLTFRVNSKGIIVAEGANRVGGAESMNSCG